MSASEKLRALDARLANSHSVPYELSDVLPQIVAVVEAAEVLAVQTFGALDSRAFYAQRETLAALDEALS